ncbi:CsbD family protein [Hymenobacter baengnokdamensis]|uniref:CsbD family protein n=1 Tax=Hymenobacter baengnokdamensis TaxID=2615203 RepID=UPI0012474E61|nr:CsbD family protein [Hymenobacter baengnokdamensis]
MDLNNNNLNDQTELRARGDWNQIKGAAKQKWGNLTDDDLTYQEGKQDEWFGQLQQKTGHAIDDIKSWFHNTFSSDSNTNTTNTSNQNRS